MNSVAGAVQAVWEDRLRDAGLRVTSPRLAVLHVVHDEPHVSADKVADRVRAEVGPVSTQAVYDTLNTLTIHRILRRFEPAGSAMRYEVRTGDNHHHLVCRRCQSVTDTPCTTGVAPCAQPEGVDGFVVDEAEVTFWGLCPSCADAPNRPIP